MTTEEMEKEIEQLREQVKELTKAIDEKSPESIYSITYSTRDGGALVTVRSRPGEKGESYLFRFKTMLDKMNALGFNTQPETNTRAASQITVAPSAAPQPAPVSASGGTLSIQVTTLSATVADGKAFWKVKGGQFEKFGLTVYPEVLVGAGLVNLDPMKTVSLVGWVADYTLKEDGKPGKVVRLHRPEHH